MKFLADLFRNRRREAWLKAASVLGAEVTPGSWFAIEKIRLRHRNWTILLDGYYQSSGKSGHHVTRFRAPVQTPSNFRFSLVKKGFLQEIGLFFGMQDVKTGSLEFDEAFILQGQPDTLVADVWDSDELRGMAPALEGGQFGIVAGFWEPSKVELTFTCIGLIQDEHRLLMLFGLFRECLDQMCDLACIDEDAPGI